jgi:hypothetical protein
VNPQRQRFDPWHIPSLLLWLIFFTLGIQPELTFVVLRTMGEVVTQNAITNSVYVISFGLAGYLAWFAFRGCRAAGESKDTASGKALQVGILALVAFLPISFLHMLEFQQAAQRFDRYASLGISVAKLWCWLYLLTVVIRFHLVDGPQVFSRMVSIFPSTHGQKHEDSVAKVELSVRKQEHARLGAEARVDDKNSAG